ncbi:MAG: HlyD family efflux transporter periplasmic adaptor subunit [Proteobacteria bacterium]|nr:HlyD family efflux transporter periplasmic adaptor subunit [Pseudomonadota bacterium]
MKLNKKNLILIVSCLVSPFLISCQSNDQNKLSGYIQGKFTYISAYYSGILQKMHVQPGQMVKKGEPLFILDPYPENTTLKAAEANVQRAVDEKNKWESNFLLEKTTNQRNLMLFKKGVISKEELDKSTEQFNTALANKKTATANLIAEQANKKQASWASYQKIVNSPIDAFVFDTYYSEHEKIIEGKPVLSLLAKDATKIIFFLPEPLLGRVKINETIQVSLDGVPDTFKARVNYISPKEEYTPPVIFSDKERQKLVFRAEALPLIDNKTPSLHPGQPLTVTIAKETNQEDR